MPSTGKKKTHPHEKTGLELGLVRVKVWAGNTVRESFGS